MKRRLGAAALALSAALALASVCAPATASTGSGSARRVGPTVSEQTMLDRLADPGEQLSSLPAGSAVYQISSHDLAGGNLDGGSYAAPLAGVLPLTYVRREGSTYVLADQHGPGCLLRIWMTSSSGGASGDAASFGNVQLFFDGSSKPAVDDPAAAFFAGKDPRFPVPLVDDYAGSSGGNYSYVPFCFSRELKVRVTGALSTYQNYFQLTFLSVPTGTRVTTFTGDERAARAAARALDRVGAAPAGRPDREVSGPVSARSALALPVLRGPAAIRYLRVHVAPFTLATLRSLRLEVDADGASSPQVDVPLADVFGDGLETRPIRSAGFGEDPRTGTGYLALPILYRRDVRVRVASASSDAKVRIEAWTAAASAATGHLYGTRVVTKTRLGRDFPVLDARGSGHLASYVMDLSQRAPLSGVSSGQWFMEGDERVYVDGLRSPSIYGTGTEDEFNGGYYFANGAFTLPFNGAGPLDSLGPLAGGAQSAYRVFADDGAIWSAGIRYSQQAGGDNEGPTVDAAATTFSYRAAQRLFASDVVRFGDAKSKKRHRLTGSGRPVSLDSYFEGVHDGTVPVSTLAIGGSYYVSPPPQLSDQSLHATGLAFRGPVSVTLRIPPDNRGVVLRRLADQVASVPVRVSVDGQSAGIWPGAEFQGDPLKRWLETDYALRPDLTAGKHAIVVSLAPAVAGETATAYTLEAWSTRR